MPLDLNQFLATFYEECSESMDSMEQNLLHLDASDDKDEAINAIFRGAHSIKGASATFGLTEVASFTHAMETLLDEMRAGRRSVTQADVDLLLDAVDHLREMMSALRAGGVPDRARTDEKRAALEAALHGAPAAASPKAPPASDEITDAEFEALLDDLHGKGKAPGAATGDTITDAEFEELLDGLHGKGQAPGARDSRTLWRIGFQPHTIMLRNGNDPLRIFRELESLGDLKVRRTGAQPPALAELDPECCYLAWSLELWTDAERAHIEEVFAWVEGECDLRIECDAPRRPAAGTATAAPAETPKTPPGPRTQTPATVPPSKPTAGPAGSAQAARAAAPAGQDATSIRVAIDKIDALINMVGELVITQSMLSQLTELVDMSRQPHLLEGLTQLERNTRELQENVMRIRMLPISFAFNRFPRLVRDLSQKLGKKVELKMTGEQTELDKTVMEKIGDPLVHLVRNSLDHGIETPERRVASGKPEVGTLHLNAYHQGGNIVIEISDDGAGLDRDRILRKARERGLVADDQAMADERVYELIFMPGFSTAEQVSDVSGRGVGMDVVRRNIKSLGGSVDITSRHGAGTTITIRLPLTLAILDGQALKVGGEIYIVPLVSIVESLNVTDDMIHRVAGRAELLRLRGEYLPIIRLYEVFSCAPRTTDLTAGLIVVVEGDGQRAGLFVDELLGQQQVVIKSLETNFTKVNGISGATILGDGRVALILDAGGLVRTADGARAEAHRLGGTQFAAA